MEIHAIENIPTALTLTDIYQDIKRNNMIALVNGATKTLEQYKESGYFGRLTSPTGTRSFRKLSSSNLFWAVDNDCYNGLNEKLYRMIIRRISNYRNELLLFVNCPDKLYDARATINLFNHWQPILKQYNLPIGFVGQDGIENLSIDFTLFDCLFIGGSDLFKESDIVRDLLQEAKRNGKWCHVGRVNTYKRLKLLFNWNCVDSIDGTSFSRWPSLYLPRHIRWMRKLQHDSTLSRHNS
jgi:hypothetical protein